MSSTTFENSVLLRQFHKFYSEVIRWKDLARSSGREYSPEVSPGGEEEPPPETEGGVETIHLRLKSLLEEQALEAGSRGGEYGAGFYREAQYVMASLADETFLNLDWEGRENWKANLLEFSLFGTHIAGDLLFQKLDRLLSDRDPAVSPLAAVYLQALSLGFRGKYRGMDDGGKLDYYRHQLFNFIFHKNPDLLSETKRLFPESYAHTLSEGGGKKLPYLKAWIVLIVLLILLILAVSHGMWVHVTADLRQIIQQILMGG